MDRMISFVADGLMEDGEWEYPPVADTLEAAGVWLIKEYIQILQDTIAEEVACQTVYDICTGVERIPGSSWLMRWWDQDVGCEEE